MAKIISERFTCRRDGLAICGTWFRPEEGDNLPIMIISHGFMVDQRSVRNYAKRFAAMGFATFSFDFNGGSIHSRSEGPTTEMSVLTEVEDLKAVIAYAGSLPWTDGLRVSLAGCSQGGMVSALTAAELQEAVERLILFYPALCIPDDARKGAMMFARFDPDNPPEVINCGPMKLGACYVNDVKNMDVFEAIRPYAGPVMILHGNKDEIVDVEYARKARKVYNGGTPAKAPRRQPRRDMMLEIIDGAGHGFNREEDEFAFGAIRQFLQGRTDVVQVDVRLDEIRRMGTPAKLHVSIPFGGKAKGIWFHGEIEPGASDEQEYAWGKPVAFAATYTITGEDYTGTPCRLDIVNRFDGKSWKPEVHTDSEALAFLNGADLTAVLQNRKKGPLVHIFA